MRIPARAGDLRSAGHVHALRQTLFGVAVGAERLKICPAVGVGRRQLPEIAMKWNVMINLHCGREHLPAQRACIPILVEQFHSGVCPQSDSLHGRCAH